MRVLCLMAIVLAGGLPLTLRAAEDGKPGKLTVYVGTYTRGTKSEGIYRMELDLASGKLSEPVVAGKTDNPSFLAIHPTGKFLYACGEIADFPGKKKGVGAINAFAIDAKGDLTLLNQQSSEGAGPCHVVLDRAGKYAFCANYGGGNAAALPIGADGKLGPASGFVQHKGSSVDKGRQEAPHAHSINLDPTNRHVFVADLGLDKVLIYQFDPEKGTLTANDPPHVEVAPGAGPRHFAFHPSGKYAYVINEMNMTVSALAYDPTSGKLEVIQSVPTVEKKQKGDSTAEVVVHPSGKFVYGSNRGANSIAVFQVDEKTGKLTPSGRQGKGIKTPRNFAVDPTGRYCLVANQDGGSVIVFRIDPKTGALTPTEHRAEIPAPVCVRMIAPK
ncbi:MAG: lactonase family protein [Gemmataceae bacterium]